MRNLALRNFAWAAVLVVTVTGCSGAPAADDAPSSSIEDAHLIVDRWTAIACGSSPVRTFTGPELMSKELPVPQAGDIELRGLCENEEILGTVSAKSQSMTVFKTPEGLQTHLATVDCGAGYLRIIGDRWVAVTRVPEYATKLSESGGKLACQNGY